MPASARCCSHWIGPVAGNTFRCARRDGGRGVLTWCQEAQRCGGQARIYLSRVLPLHLYACPDRPERLQIWRVGQCAGSRSESGQGRLHDKRSCWIRTSIHRSLRCLLDDGGQPPRRENLARSHRSIVPGDGSGAAGTGPTNRCDRNLASDDRLLWIPTCASRDISNRGGKLDRLWYTDQRNAAIGRKPVPPAPESRLYG